MKLKVLKHENWRDLAVASESKCSLSMGVGPGEALEK